MKHNQGYPHSIGQSAHMPMPDIKGGEIAWSPTGGTASCVILCQKGCELPGMRTQSTALLQPPPDSPALIPSAQGGHLECSKGKDGTESEVAAAAVSTLPCFVFISLWGQKAEWVGKEMRWKTSESTETFLINRTGHSGSAWGKRQSDLSVHPRGLCLEECNEAHSSQPSSSSINIY